MMADDFESTPSRRFLASVGQGAATVARSVAAAHHAVRGHVGAPLGAVRGSQDTVVILAEGAPFANGRRIELAGATHYSYLLRPTAWSSVWETLQDSSR